MSWRKSLFLLFCVSSTISFVVLFRITIHSHTSTPPPTIPSPHRNSCSSTNLTARKHLQHVSQKLTCQSEPYNEGAFTTKEYLLLSNLVSRKAPCNLLFFGGATPQFLGLAALNTQGITVFLEDHEEKIKKTAQESGRRARAYKIRYNTKAGNAYRLLKHAREHFGCKLEASPFLHETGCELALAGLPDEVYAIKWDVIVVDGPRGDHGEAPGRMGAIYTAAVIAKRGNVTDVFVHDVDRMVEKWYSWEFLCQENLVSSRGNLWHFEVRAKSRFSGFCPEANIQTL